MEQQAHCEHQKTKLCVYNVFPTFMKLLMNNDFNPKVNRHISSTSII